MSKSILPSPTKGNKKSTSPTKAKNASKKFTELAPAGDPSRVTIRVGTKENSLALASLDPAAIHDIVEQLGKSGQQGSVTLRVTPAGWSVADRERFWSLFRALQGDTSDRVTLSVDGKTFPRPLDWATNCLLDPTNDPAARCRALETAADILTHAYASADRDVYLENLLSKLRDWGFSGERCADVKRNIRQRLRGVGGGTESAPGVGGSGGVGDLAKLFLSERYPPTGSAQASKLDHGHAPPQYGLRYYSDAFYRRRSDVWTEASSEDVKLELTSFLQTATPDRTGVRHVNDVFINLKAHCAMRVENSPPLPFHTATPNRRMLAFRNGLLDLSALAEVEVAGLRPHDPDWFSTFRLTYPYAPDAKYPKFKAFLGQILNADPKTLKSLTEGDNRVKVVQELFGYSLLPDNRFQTFAIFTGNGRNGKGTIFDIWGQMIGQENTASVPLEAMCKEFGTESLVGKMLNLAGDMNDVDAAVEGTLKSWTGEDRVTVPRKYKSALQVEPVVKFIYGCNKLPWFKDKSDGVWRRLIVVPFNYAPKSLNDVDSQLRRKLKTELPGILNWALRGLARLLERGRFTDCDVCATAKDDHREACSPVKEFITNHFTLAAEYAGPKENKKFLTTTTEVKFLVKEYGAKFGEKPLHSNVVCRELAGMAGVFTQRPTTVSGRTEFGNIYCGVCIGEPKPLVPGEIDEMVAKTGLHELQAPPVLVPHAAGAHGKSQPGKAKAKTSTAAKPPKGGK